MDSQRGAALALSNVHLLIENVLPRTSLTSHEDRKAAAATVRATNTLGASHYHGHHDHHDHQQQQDDDEPHQSFHHQQQQPHLQPKHQSQPSPKDHDDNDGQWMHHELADRLAWLHPFFKPDKKGGLVFLDQDTLKKQQGVFKEVMLQVGSQLLTGKLAVRISLPIRIFEPRTLLERVADGWNYAPTLLRKAAHATTDPLERMKLVMAFVVGGFHLCVGQRKPFNPILGETYEASYADGTQLFLEHVAHHPVQSAFHVVGPGQLYEIRGVYEFESVTSRNTIYNHQIGTTTIRFHDGHRVTYTLPQIKMSGLLFGERVVEMAGVATFDDAAHALHGELSFGANSGGFLFGKSQADDIKGQIVCQKSHSGRSTSSKPLSMVHGSWLTHLQCDGKAYWRVESEPAFAHVPVPEPLPSDCRFRTDLVALQQGDLELAQSEKLRLEELQRSDHKLREHAAKHAHRTRRGSSSR